MAGRKAKSGMKGAMAYLRGIKGADPDKEKTERRVVVPKGPEGWREKKSFRKGNLTDRKIKK